MSGTNNAGAVARLVVTKRWGAIRHPSRCDCPPADALVLSPPGGCLQGEGRKARIAFDAVFCMCCGREKIGALPWGVAYARLWQEWGWKREFGLRLQELFESLSSCGMIRWPDTATTPLRDGDAVLVRTDMAYWQEPPPAEQVQALLDAGWFRLTARTDRHGNPVLKVTKAGRAWLPLLEDAAGPTRRREEAAHA